MLCNARLLMWLVQFEIRVATQPSLMLLRVSPAMRVKMSVVTKGRCCHPLRHIRLVPLNSSFRSSLIVIRKLLTRRFATLRAIPLHEILFALTSHSLSVTSSLLLIRFAIFRALDIYSDNSVNIVFLQQPRLV